MIKKILDHRGESISEVLVAGLVISLGFIMITTMINASFNLITKEEEKYAEDIVNKNMFETVDFTGGSPGDTVMLNITRLSGCDSISGVNVSYEVKLYSKTVGEKTLRKYSR